MTCRTAINHLTGEPVTASKRLVEDDMADKWKVGTDIFGATHVYNEGGERLTNDRMNGVEGWEDMARLIAAAPDLAKIVWHVAYPGDYEGRPSDEVLREMSLSLLSRVREGDGNG